MRFNRAGLLDKTKTESETKTMKAIKASRQDFDKKEIYKLTKGETIRVQDSAGVVLNVADYLEYEDVNSRGETVRMLALMDTDGHVYTTISETFKQRFYEIVDIFGDELKTTDIIITTGTSKAGRSYMSCTLA